MQDINVYPTEVTVNLDQHEDIVMMSRDSALQRSSL